MQAFGIIIVSFICITIFGTLFYSILSRRAEEGVMKWMYQARMNVNMGLMFLSIGTLQLMLPSSSWIRYVLITFILGLGLINLYYGLKNWIHFHINEKDIEEDPELSK